MNSTPTRGFTLMELLVVIAIIGMLAGVVLSALNTARSKGADGAIKANLNNARGQAELFYDAGNINSYEGVCAIAGSNTIGRIIRAAENIYDGGASTYADGTPSTWNNAQCHDSQAAWVAWVPLKGSTSASPLAWCVDSTGISTQETTVIAGNAMACP